MSDQIPADVCRNAMGVPSTRRAHGGR